MPRFFTQPLKIGPGHFMARELTFPKQDLSSVVIEGNDIYLYPQGLAYTFRYYSFLPADQGLADCDPKFLESVGLAQEYLGQFGMVAGHDLGLVIAAGQDHREVGREFAQCGQCLPVVHARHCQVGKDATCPA